MQMGLWPAMFIPLPYPSPLYLKIDKGKGTGRKVIKAHAIMHEAHGTRYGPYGIIEYFHQLWFMKKIRYAIWDKIVV